MSYLDENGLTYLWSKIKENIPTNNNLLTNGAGYITSITSTNVTTALGYIPYNASNPNGYTSNIGTITGITMNGSSKGTSGTIDLGTVITSETDPVFSSSTASSITSDDITNWNDVVHASTGGTFNGDIAINCGSYGSSLSVGSVNSDEYSQILLQSSNGTTTFDNAQFGGRITYLLIGDATLKTIVGLDSIDNTLTAVTDYPFKANSTGTFDGAVTINATDTVFTAGDTTQSTTNDLLVQNSLGLVGLRAHTTSGGSFGMWTLVGTAKRWIWAACLNNGGTAYAYSNLPIVYTSANLGSTLPTTGIDGQVFFKTS